mgnify:FL=1
MTTAPKNMSLNIALEMLELFTLEKSEYQVKEIAEQLNIANSTAHRILKTMEEEGFIVKDHVTKRYRLGVSILALSNVIHSTEK